MFAIAEGDSAVIVGLLSLLGVLATVAGVQVKVHRDNRKDHGETAAKVDRLLENQDEFRRDVTYVRADLSTIRGELTELRAEVSDLRHVDSTNNARISRLENHHPGGDAA